MRPTSWFSGQLIYAFHSVFLTDRVSWFCFRKVEGVANLPELSVAGNIHNVVTSNNNPTVL